MSLICCRWTRRSGCRRPPRTARPYQARCDTASTSAPARWEGGRWRLLVTGANFSEGRSGRGTVSRRQPFSLVLMVAVDPNVSRIRFSPASRLPQGYHQSPGLRSTCGSRACRRWAAKRPRPSDVRHGRNRPMETVRFRPIAAVHGGQLTAISGHSDVSTNLEAM